MAKEEKKVVSLVKQEKGETNEIVQFLRGLANDIEAGRTRTKQPFNALVIMEESDGLSIACGGKFAGGKAHVVGVLAIASDMAMDFDMRSGEEGTDPEGAA